MARLTTAGTREQQEIVRRVKALFDLVNQIETRYTKAVHFVDSLKQSILAKAFRGELVPQDPDNETRERPAGKDPRSSCKTLISR
jgi:hypothetical protein